MIDLDKEREAFEDAYQHHRFIKHVYRAGNHYSVMPNLNIAKDKKKIIVDLANSSWNAWQRCSLRAQEEITELKKEEIKYKEKHGQLIGKIHALEKKLARYENPDYVLVPRKPKKKILSKIGIDIRKANFINAYSQDALEKSIPLIAYKAIIEAVEKEDE